MWHAQQGKGHHKSKRYHKHHRGVDAKVAGMVDDETAALKEIDKGAPAPNGSDSSAISSAGYVPPYHAPGTTDE